MLEPLVLEFPGFEKCEGSEEILHKNSEEFRARVRLGGPVLRVR
jgi:hypothetical protein